MDYSLGLSGNAEIIRVTGNVEGDSYFADLSLTIDPRENEELAEGIKKVYAPQKANVRIPISRKTYLHLQGKLEKLKYQAKPSRKIIPRIHLSGELELKVDGASFA